MTTAWSHLPNATYIDRIIVSVKADPKTWSQTWYNPHHVPVAAVERLQIRFEAKNKGWDTLWPEIRAAFITPNPAKFGDQYYNSRLVVRDATLVLIVYDECGYMLDSDPGELALIAKLGDTRAALMWQACTALLKEREFE